MKKIILGLLSFVVTINISACAQMSSGIDAKLENKLEKEFDEARRGPKGSPYKSITNFSDSLACMDKLMVAGGIRNIPVMIEDIYQW
jgi:hypothetical protein